MLGTKVFTISDVVATFISFDQSIFGSVNMVTFNNNPNALVFDDLTVNGSNASSVPEPASLTCWASVWLAWFAFVSAARIAPKSKTTGEIAKGRRERLLSAFSVS